MRSDRGTAMHAASPRAARESGDASRLPSTPEAGFDGVDDGGVVVVGGVAVAGGVVVGVDSTEAVASAGGIVTGRLSTLLVNTAVAWLVVLPGCVSVVVQEYVHDSPTSSWLSLSVSPPVRVRFEHTSSPRMPPLCGFSGAGVDELF